MGAELEGLRRGLIPEDVLRVATAAGVAISPDGSWLAYGVKRCDAERNGYQAHLYLVCLETRATRKLTDGGGQASWLTFSRDSQRLAYVWQDEGAWELRIVEVAGGQVTSFRAEGAAPAELDWSPDGRQLACSRWTEMRSRREPQVAKGVPAPTVRVVSRLRYKQDGVGWVHNRYQQIWLLVLEGGVWRQLTDGECDYSEPAFSHSGKKLAFTALAREQNTTLGQGQILVWALQTGRIERLMPTWQGAAASPQWRWDDGAVAFAGFPDPPPVNRRRYHHIWLYELASGQARELQAGLDNMVGTVGSRSLKWPGGRGPIWFPLTELGATVLYCVDEGAAWRCMGEGGKVVHGFAASETGACVYDSGDPLSPSEVYLRRSEGQVERLTDLNPWLSSMRLSSPEEYWYHGLDGSRVHAWVMKPVGFQADKYHPLALQVHCSMFSWDFNIDYQCLASAGYVVAYFNQLGTTAGYGQAYTMASPGDQGGRDFEEIMLGVDDLIAKGYVDEKRMGVTGTSCGGFLSNWIVGHTDRFAAAIPQASISDYISFFGTSDIGPECTEGETLANPWTDLAAVWRQSPIKYVENVRTPVLLLHGTEDHRCALAQAEEMFAALRWMGKEVELVIFEGESHGMSRNGRPGNRIERLSRILGWFGKYLRTEPTQK